MRKTAQASTASQGKPIALPLSKQPNRDRYNLILSIAELKTPVLSLVQSIMRPEDKENIVKNTKAKSAAKTQAEAKEVNRSSLAETHKAMSKASSSQELKKPRGKASFTEKVHRLFAARKYNYGVGGDEDNIDRLNAKLDKYISRYLGPERLRLNDS